MFNTGQRVWWVEQDRDAGKTCRVWVREAGYMTGRHDGSKTAVVDANARVEFLSESVHLFPNPDDATSFALGLAARRIHNFGYTAVTITDHTGKTFTLRTFDLEPKE